MFDQYVVRLVFLPSPEEDGRVWFNFYTNHDYFLVDINEESVSDDIEQANRFNSQRNALGYVTKLKQYYESRGYAEFVNIDVKAIKL